LFLNVGSNGIVRGQSKFYIPDFLHITTQLLLPAQRILIIRMAATLKNIKFKQILAVSAIILVFPNAGNWKADTANAKVTFSLHGPFGTVHGSFTGLEASINFNEKSLSGSSITASIDAKTVSTGVKLRNNDLRNKEEWLNTDKYPRITFKSKKIEKTDNGFKASGDLTIKSVTRPAEIAFTFTSKDATGIFKGQFTIKREDYHVGKPGGSVGSVITIILIVPVKN
jgi:polyisoprenoid-binding protein YceI